MTTRLNRRVVRETAFRHQGRPIIVELGEGGKVVRLRQKGRHKWYQTTVEAVYWLAVRAETAAIAAAKQKAREERRRQKKQERK